MDALGTDEATNLDSAEASVDYWREGRLSLCCG